MDKISSALVLIAYMSWQVWNHPDLLILAQEEKDSRKEDNVENFIVDKDDDVPDVVTDHGASDGVIVLNDDNGVDGTVKGGRLYYIFLAFSILLFFFLSSM